MKIKLTNICIEKDIIQEDFRKDKKTNNGKFIKQKYIFSKIRKI